MRMIVVLLYALSILLVAFLGAVRIVGVFVFGWVEYLFLLPAAVALVAIILPYRYFKRSTVCLGFFAIYFIFSVKDPGTWSGFLFEIVAFGVLVFLKHFIAKKSWH